jgi:hypothetical protein
MKSQGFSMTKIKLAKSAKKYIRKEKARIRREIVDLDERDKKIQELLDRFYLKNVSLQKDNPEKKKDKKPEKSQGGKKGKAKVKKVSKVEKKKKPEA